jgi:membrane protein implicated in regulation of membrane protease activity
VTLLRRIFRSSWEFVVGDDWIVALGVVVALAATWFVTHHGRNWYWLLPSAVVVLLVLSIRRFIRKG